MKLIDAFNKIKALEQSVVLTNEIAAYLDISTTHASKLLSRLCKSHNMIYLRRNTWAMKDIDQFELPTHLTAPFPCYISLQSALYHHGMISQIPNTIYAVSLARTQLFRTEIANISIHHIQPDFFFNFETITTNPLIKIAIPEKALIDVFYLGTAKSALFKTLPEIELPRKFNWKKAEDIVSKIPSDYRQNYVRQKIKDFKKRIKA